MIFYFSGTGNTKWAASKTAAALDDQLIDIAATLKHADSDSTFSYELKDDEPVGFFFPVHGWRPPLIVKEFVRRLRINQSGSYCYVVCTAGDNVGEAVDILEKDLAEVGIKVHSAISLIMPESYVGLPFMDVDKPEKKPKEARSRRETLEVHRRHTPTTPRHTRHPHRQLATHQQPTHRRCVHPLDYQRHPVPRRPQPLHQLWSVRQQLPRQRHGNGREQTPSMATQRQVPIVLRLLSPLPHPSHRVRRKNKRKRTILL